VNDANPLTILIGALGGEGGGLLTDWIVLAARMAKLPVQSTSIPGVAQRTGATTYYIEIFPTPTEQSPLMSLYPGPGNVDVVVASELMEAGRAIENGFVSPDRTTLIASTHRIYSIAEKSAMGDGLHDSGRVLAAARAMSRTAMLHDIAGIARRENTALNAVLLGLIAGAENMPVSRDAFEGAIAERGVAVDGNKRGFTIGLALAKGAGAKGDFTPHIEPRGANTPAPRTLDDLPAPVAEFAASGVDRLRDYQDDAYARQYLDRLGPVLGVDSENRDWALSREVARYLALWMSYEDVIRVAGLKTHSDRTQRVRAEVGAKPDEPVRVTEFLKPGIDEFSSLLPPTMARALIGWAARRGLTTRLQWAMRVRTDTIFGFLQLWLLARLRWWRRSSYRFQVENTLIEGWLDAVVRLAVRDYGFALEWVQCANLLKGYGETQAKGHANFGLIFDALIAPVLDGGPADVAILAGARAAALADPEGSALADALADVPTR
jgi:indolepyruvate ferredoxin oxidoreductase beta subunit